MTTLEELTQRVGRLERENRILQLIAVVIVLCLMVLISVGAGGKPRTVEAGKFVILDSHGRARITIGTPALAGAAIDMEPDAPGIWLSDEGGTDRAILTVDGIRFANARGKPLAELSSKPTPGNSLLRFYGTNGEVSWSAP